MYDKILNYNKETLAHQMSSWPQVQMHTSALYSYITQQKDSDLISAAIFQPLLGALTTPVGLTVVLKILYWLGVERINQKPALLERYYQIPAGDHAAEGQTQCKDVFRLCYIINHALSRLEPVCVTIIQRQLNFLAQKSPISRLVDPLPNQAFFFCPNAIESIIAIYQSRNPKLFDQFNAVHLETFLFVRPEDTIGFSYITPSPGLDPLAYTRKHLTWFMPMNNIAPPLYERPDMHQGVAIHRASYCRPETKV
jgi:hypothetical protein